MIKKRKLTKTISKMNKKPLKKRGRKPKSVNLKYVLVRTYSAGVFAGYLESRNGREVVLRKARRIWYWDGAASLSQLAMEGVKKPQNCKFPCEVDRIELLEAVEIMDMPESARINIANVPIWTATDEDA